MKKCINVVLGVLICTFAGVQALAYFNLPVKVTRETNNKVILHGAFSKKADCIVDGEYDILSKPYTTNDDPVYLKKCSDQSAFVEVVNGNPCLIITLESRTSQMPLFRGGGQLLITDTSIDQENFCPEDE